MSYLNRLFCNNLLLFFLSIFSIYTRGQAIEREFYSDGTAMLKSIYKNNVYSCLFGTNGLPVKYKCVKESGDSICIRLVYNGELLDSTIHYYNGLIQRKKSYFADNQDKEALTPSIYSPDDFYIRMFELVRIKAKSEIVYYRKDGNELQELREYDLINSSEYDKKSFCKLRVKHYFNDEKEKVNGQWSMCDGFYYLNANFLNGNLNGVSKNKYFDTEENDFHLIDSGSYVNNLKEGMWSENLRFLESDHSSLLSSDCSNSISNLFKSHEYFASGRYEKGKRQGKWILGLRTNFRYGNFWEALFDKGNPIGIWKSYDGSRFNIASLSFKKDSSQVFVSSGDSIVYKNYILQYRKKKYDLYDENSKDSKYKLFYLKKPGWYEKVSYYDTELKILKSKEVLYLGKKNGACYYYNYEDGSMHDWGRYVNDICVEYELFAEPDKDKQYVLNSNKGFTRKIGFQFSDTLFNKDVFIAEKNRKLAKSIELKNEGEVKLDNRFFVDKNTFMSKAGNIVSISNIPGRVPNSPIFNFVIYSPQNQKYYFKVLNLPEAAIVSDYLEDSNGNIIVVGQFGRVVPGFFTFEKTDAFIAKYDSAFKLIMVKQFPYRGFTSLMVDTADNIYIIGESRRIVKSLTYRSSNYRYNFLYSIDNPNINKQFKVVSEIQRNKLEEDAVLMKKMSRAERKMSTKKMQAQKQTSVEDNKDSLKLESMGSVSKIDTVWIKYFDVCCIKLDNNYNLKWETKFEEMSGLWLGNSSLELLGDKLYTSTALLQECTEITKIAGLNISDGKLNYYKSPLTEKALVGFDFYFDNKSIMHVHSFVNLDFKDPFLLKEKLSIEKNEYRADYFINMNLNKKGDVLKYNLTPAHTNSCPDENSKVYRFKIGKDYLLSIPFRIQLGFDTIHFCLTNLEGKVIKDASVGISKLTGFSDFKIITNREHTQFYVYCKTIPEHNHYVPQQFLMKLNVDDLLK